MTNGSTSRVVMVAIAVALMWPHRSLVRKPQKPRSYNAKCARNPSKPRAGELDLIWGLFKSP